MDLTSYDVIVVNSSAGKDSQAMLDVVVEMATAQGVRDRLVVAHCDLGRVEWQGTRDLAERQAAHYGIRFEVVSRKQGDLLQQIRDRGMFPASNARYCTSDQKRGPIRSLLTRLADEQRAKGIKRPRILNCMGLRAEESSKRRVMAAFEHCASKTCPCPECDALRAKAAEPFAHEPKVAGMRKEYCECETCAPIAQAKSRLADGNSNTRRHVDDYLPIHSWVVSQVWARIKQSGVPYHPAYDLGMPRLSCVFCIFAPKAALMLAGKHNPELLNEYVALEAEIGHKFSKKLALADIKAALDRGEEAGEAQAWGEM